MTGMVRGVTAAMYYYPKGAYFSAGTVCARVTNWEADPNIDKELGGRNRVERMIVKEMKRKINKNVNQRNINLVYPTKIEYEVGPCVFG